MAIIKPRPPWESKPVDTRSPHRIEDRKGRKFCLHCGKPRATKPVQYGKIQLWAHEACLPEVSAEKLHMATNGKG